MINLSKAATREIKRMQSRQQNSTARLRLGIQPGGCADLFYTIEFDDAVHDRDEVFDCNGIQVVVDSQSLNRITGLTLDYSEDLMGGAFRFHNPNAVSSCGCGNSFSTVDS